MEATLRNFLYRYLYLKLGKDYVLLSLIFSIQQNQRTRGWNRFCLRGSGGKDAGEDRGGQTMYTHGVNVKMIK
jgi:hypothetical protein